MNTLIPTHDLSIGVNTYSFVWSTPAWETVALFKDHGFTDFELMLNPPHLAIDDFSAAERDRFASFLATSGLTVQSINVPSLDHNLASPMRRMRQYSMTLFSDAIDLAADIGASYVVVVPGRLSPLFPPPAQLREAWMRESLDPLVAHAQKRGVKIALENVPFASFPDAKSLGDFVRSYHSDAVAVCYDVANAHFIGESPAQALRALADVLAIVHLSDTTQATWRHDEIGLGDLSFQDVLTGLRDSDFQGPCMMEIIARENPVDALLRSRAALARLGYCGPLEVAR